MGAVRLFLAYAVLTEHFDQQVLAPDKLDFNPLWSLYINGGRAVLLFYIISGFLISYVLHEKYPKSRAGIFAFYRSRFLRIYPLWWVLLVAAIAFDLWRHSPDPLSSNLFPAGGLFGLDWIVPLWKFPAFDWSVLPYHAAIGWTLGAEVTFYLLAPFILRSNRIAFALLLGSAAIRTAILSFVARADPGYVNLTLFFFPATLMFFLLGHFGAVICRYRPIGLAGSLGLLCVVIALSSHAANHVTFDNWATHLSPVCFALALPGLFAATKDNRFLNYLGDLTYPLYLMHSLTFVALFPPVKVRLDDWLPPIFTTKAAAPVLILGVFLPVLVAIATHHLIEPISRVVVSRAIDGLAAIGRMTMLSPRQSRSDGGVQTFSQDATRILQS
jgi:peptidoglycan/LPS O-acetylase OafA/YrhL